MVSNLDFIVGHDTRIMVSNLDFIFCVGHDTLNMVSNLDFIFCAGHDTRRMSSILHFVFCQTEFLIDREIFQLVIVKNMNCL